MIDEFSYDELIKYLEGEADETLLNKIVAKKETDQEFSEMLENLKGSQRIIKYIANQKRKEKFESWLKEDTQIKKRNYFFFLKIAASVLFFISIFYIIFLSDPNKLKSFETVGNQNISNSSNLNQDSIIASSNNKFIGDKIYDTEIVHQATPAKEINQIKNKSSLKQNDNNNDKYIQFDEELSWAINESSKAEFMNTYEFDQIPGFTRGLNTDPWKHEAKFADSLYYGKLYEPALVYYQKLSHHPEIWERIAFTYSKVGADSLALKFYDKYKVLQENKDVSDWGEWLLLLNAYPKYKKEFINKTNEILSLPNHKYSQNVKRFRKKISN